MMDRRSFFTGSLATAAAVALPKSADAALSLPVPPVSQFSGTATEILNKYSMARDLLCVDHDPAQSRPPEGEIHSKMAKRAVTSYMKDDGNEVFVPSFHIGVDLTQHRDSSAIIFPKREGEKLRGSVLGSSSGWENPLDALATVENRECLAALDGAVSISCSLECSEAEFDVNLEKAKSWVESRIEGKAHHTTCGWNGVSPKVAYVFPPPEEFGVIPIYQPPTVSHDRKWLYEEIGICILYDTIVKICVV